MPDLYIRALEANLEEAQTAVERVRAIHVRNSRFPHYCVQCRAPWPCKTIRALDGEAVADE